MPPQFIQRGPSRRTVQKEMMAQSLGQGLGNMMSEHFASKKLEEVLSNKEMENLPFSERVNKIQTAMNQFGEVGEKKLQQRLGIEQQRLQEQSQGAISKYLKGEPLSSNEERLIPPEIQLKKMQIETKPPSGGISAQPIPPEVSQAIGQILGNSKEKNADELAQSFDQLGIPRAYTNSYIENRRRQDEAAASNQRSNTAETRKELFPLKKSIIDQADISRESIRNKSHLIDIIDRGDLNDPTFAIFAENLPLNLGKRLLSNDTVEYKSGLIDEFADLKNIFKGATRVKEVELYENKLADIYLDDSQKKAILKSRINADKINLIREEAAQEVEEKYPNVSALQFNKKVDEIAKPKMDKLFNSVWEEQKSILDQAERRKQIPLDPADPEDKKIMTQIFNEANGNKEEAKKLAKKKGYTVKGM